MFNSSHLSNFLDFMNLSSSFLISFEHFFFFLNFIQKYQEKSRAETLKKREQFALKQQYHEYNGGSPPSKF
jgi:hypothetical protein